MQALLLGILQLEGLQWKICAMNASYRGGSPFSSLGSLRVTGHVRVHAVHVGVLCVTKATGKVSTRRLTHNPALLVCTLQHKHVKQSRLAHEVGPCQSDVWDRGKGRGAQPDHALAQAALNTGFRAV